MMYRQHLLTVDRGRGMPVLRRAGTRSEPAPPERLPLRARALLGLLDLIERILLEHCPVRSLRRAGLASVDRAHARIREWLDHRTPCERM